MQEFDPKVYPNLVKLDGRVKSLLSEKKTVSWDTPRVEYEICKRHPIYWMEQYGFILPGEIDIGESASSEADPIPFKLNPVQLRVADKVCAHFTGDVFTRVQVIVLKHRKAGISTLIAAFDYWFMRFYLMQAFSIADLGSHTDNIVSMVKLFCEKDECGTGCNDPRFRPPRLVPMPRQKKGIKLSCGAMMEQDSGENSNPGTSGTVTVLHMSENAKWRDPENAETSLLNSVPRRGFVFVVKESTAYGLNKYATDCEEAWQGKSNWEFVFITWLNMPDCEDPVHASQTIQLTTEEKAMMAAYPTMTLGHVMFRRRQIDLLHSPDLFRQDFPLNPREPFLVTGTNYFDTRLVEERLMEVKFYRDWKMVGFDGLSEKYPELVTRLKSHPRGLRAALGKIEDNCCIPNIVEFTENDSSVSWLRNKDARLESGAALMFRTPIPNHKYLVVIDVAEGKKTADYVSDDSVVEVLDCYTLEQVLEWSGRFDEEVTAQYAVMIAKVYCNAIIAPEMNNKCGGLLWTELEKTGYKKLYYRETISGNKRKREPGWHTSVGNKKDVCGQFRLDFKNGTILVHSEDLLSEMMYFTDKQGRLEAAEGHKDDKVSAMSIGTKIISVTPALRDRRNADGNRTNMLAVDTQFHEPDFSDGESLLAKHNAAVIRRYM